LSRYAGLGNRNNSVNLKIFTAFQQNPVRVFLSRFLWNGTVAVEIKDEALTFQRLLGKCGFSTAGSKAGYLHLKAGGQLPVITFGGGTGNQG